MNTITLLEASGNLAKVIESTINNSDETVIVSTNGSVVMVDQNYWEEIQETLRLLSDKQSLTALIEGHGKREDGKPIVSKNIGETFHDLQD